MIPRFYHFLFCVVLLTSGCSLTRRLPDEALLYTGSELQLHASNSEINTRRLETSAEALLEHPAPNKRFLGVRWGLRFYNLFYTEKEKGLWAWLQKKLGEPPVRYDERITRQTERLLEDLAFNEGFFWARAESEVLTDKGKAKPVYHLSFTKPYTIRAYEIQVARPDVRDEIDGLMDQSFIRAGMRYELSRLQDERERIAQGLRNRGYYFFQGDFLQFSADTTRGEREVGLRLRLKTEVPAADLKPQYIQQIAVYPDYQFGRSLPEARDTIRQTDLTFIAQELTVEPEVLNNAIVLRSGERYSPEDHRNTLRRLSLLSFYKFVDVQYERAAASDTLLRARVYLTPRKKYTAEGSAGLSVRSSAYLGPEFTLALEDRNFRDRLEQLRLEGFGNFNIPLTEAFRYYQKIGFTGQLLRQGLRVPFRQRPLSQDLVGQTRIGLNFTSEQVRLPLNNFKLELERQGLNELLANLENDSTYAPYARINRLDVSYAFQWTRRPDIRHDLVPLQVILQSAAYEEPQLRDFLRNQEIFSSTRGTFLNLERMLIFKPNYTHTYDSRLRQMRKHNFFNQGRVALSGNLLLTKEELFTLQSLQTLFLQLENDGRYYFRVYDRQTFAFRLASSIAIPFRRGAVLPFIDLYNVGGANSIRAFPPRQIGPGSVEPREETFFLSSNGDLKLEGSVEWRQKLTSLFEIAVFVDAGNVWELQKRENVNENAVFRWDQFYRQIAVGAGFGVRLDFEVLLLRLDFAIPLVIPWLPEGQRWVGDKINPGNPEWRRDNLNFNLAFGYPF